ncbi:hypothetical protein L7F22_041670 [Adiantum nelumboides]|nr:hypothetical protein [Adiantum nelumboides]
MPRNVTFVKKDTLQMNAHKQNKDDKSDRKGKKPKPSAGLVLDLVGDQQNVDATELCRAWGKVRDQEVLVFFDPGARANFISLELASKLGIRVEEMGMTGESGLACLGHSEAVTPILGKLCLHIQSYVVAEEVHIMPLQDCDVLLDELPPKRPEDYRIDVVPGSSPPNRPPYKAKLRKMKGKERLFPKLGMRYYGPFQVCNKISDVAYRLKLPEGWKIHNAFHVSLLRPFVGDVPEDMVPEEQPEVEELDEILVPEQILAHKDRKVKGKVARRYLVKFKNYSPMDAKWMEEAELVDSPQLLQLYLEAFQLQPKMT